MILTSIARTQYSAVLLLIVFSVVITLFSGYHSIKTLDGQATSHHSDDFTCLFLICLAIVIFSILLTVFLTTAAIPETFPTPKLNPLFLLEKPPRIDLFQG